MKTDYAKRLAELERRIARLERMARLTAARVADVRDRRKVHATR